MSHPLLEHRAVIELCRRSGWVGDWRDLCAERKLEHDQERFEADGGEKLFAHLGPEPKTYDQKSRAEYWDKRREIFNRYVIVNVEKKIRIPPLPFHSQMGTGAAGGCRVCGHPIYKARSYKANAGPRTRSASWHAMCYSAYYSWVKADTLARWLAARQRGACAYSGATIAQWVELDPNDWRRGPNPWPDRWKSFRPQTHAWKLLPDVEVDHFVPLWKVARMIVSWPRVLNYWGPENLRAVTSTAHKAKSRQEAGERARLRLELADQGEFYV